MEDPNSNALLAPLQKWVGPKESDSKYVIREELGQGSFGKVWRVTRRADQVHFVAKVILLQKLDERSALRARSEVACLASCEHFACIRFVEDVCVNGTLLIIMEYCDAGDLHFQLKNKRLMNNGQPIGFGDRDVRLILLQLVLALNHMHRRKMLHRDIKATNVLLLTSGLVKLGDFGLSRAYDRTISEDVAQTFCGTLDYLAPEVWKRQKYGAKADVWSLGIVMYECLKGHRPFFGEDMQNLILNAEIKAWPDTISADLQDVVKRMLEKDPAKRISVREILATKLMEDTVQDFLTIVQKTKKLSEEVRRDVISSIAEVDELRKGTPAPPPIVDFEGVVGKLKDGQFVDRYLVLKDGLIGIFRDANACADLRSSGNSRSVADIANVAIVPAKGANTDENVFVIDFGGDMDNCVWLRSAKADEWVSRIKAFMKL